MRSRAVIACILFGACSFSASGPPPGYQAVRGGPPPDCTDSFTGRALLDLTGIAASLLVTYYAYGFCDAFERGGCVGRATPYASIAALYAAGIAFGVAQTSRCSRARTQHRYAQYEP